MKTMSIEAFLRWAYYDEWPKAAREPGAYVTSAVSGGGFERWVASGAPEHVHDGVNRYGVIALQDDRLLAPIHPDADILHAALEALDEEFWPAPDPDGDMPIEDWTGTPIELTGAAQRYLDADDIARGRAHYPAALRAAWRKACQLVSYQAMPGEPLRYKARPSALIMQCCVTRPGVDAWAAHAPALSVVCGENGKPLWHEKRMEAVYGRAEKNGERWHAPIVGHREVEIIASTKHGRKPSAAAYRKWVFATDPTVALAARAEWRLAMTALDRLVAAFAAPADAGADAPMIMVTPRTQADSPWTSGQAAAQAA